MSKGTRFKMALGELDPNVRSALLYLESLVHEKHREALSAIPQTKPTDNSAILVSIDSLQKQIDGLRPKVDAAHDLVEEHDGREKYLKKLIKDAETILEEMKKYFEERYKSGYYSEGTRRKIREEGLLINGGGEEERRKKG